MSKLLAYNWPGNIRELENAIERAVALETDTVIDVVSLPENIRGISGHGSSLIPTEIPPEGIYLENVVDEIEKDLLVKALERTGGVKKRAARLLNLSFRSFRYRLDKFHIDDNSPED